jgi:hypothetical protein
LSFQTVSSREALAETSGANATHDPSRIVESNEKFDFCSTGGTCASSNDWKQVTVGGIAVTNGTCQIGLDTTASANQWVDLDDVLLVKTPD